MLYMLDTNMCSYIIRDNPKGVFEKLKEIEKKHTVALSSIVVSELLYGAKKRESAKLGKIVSLFIEQFAIYDYDKASAQAYAKIRTALEKKGEVIGVHDMLISAHALSVGATIVTNNTKEFERVAGLSVENWV
jgi:tRNA(fMet)-specific endonuclease VapC